MNRYRRSWSMRPSPPVGLCSILFIVGAALLAVGCSGKKVATKSSPELDRYQIRSVAVLPFATLETPQAIRSGGPDLPVPEGALKSDITLSPAATSKNLREPTDVVPLEAGMKVARIFAGQLGGFSGILVIPPAETEPQVKFVAISGKASTQIELGQQVARRVRADSALIGLVRVYRERVGGKYGADPATVGFEVKLVAGNGRVLWAGRYYEAQKPMNEDFKGFMDRGFGFRTADELARYGVRKVLSEFPYGQRP